MMLPMATRRSQAANSRLTLTGVPRLVVPTKTRFS